MSTTSSELDELIEKASQVRMTPAQRRQQAISFAYGNTHIENPRITRDMVEAAYDRLLAEGRI